MRFQKIDSNVMLYHGDQELRWIVKVLLRGRGGPNKAKNDEDLPTVDPFYHLNIYLERLPVQQQNQLFDVYKSIHNILTDPFGASNVGDLRRKLPPFFKRIFEICKPEDVSAWVHTTTSIVFPANIRVYETLEESAKQGDQFGLSTRPSEATYIRKDYWGLVVFVVMLRMLVPIWGQFFENTTSGNDGQISNDVKEIYALRLATQTALAKTDGYRRMAEYVGMYLSLDKYKNSVIAGGVAKEDVPFQILAILAVRRMAWVDYSGRDPEFNLVGRVYSFIEQQLDGADRTLNEQIKPKTPEGGAGNDHENRQSVSEIIKIKEAYSAGDLTIVESAARKPALFLARICPDLPPEILASAMQIIEPLKKNPPTEAQFMLLQNVMGAEIRTRNGLWEKDPKLQETWDALFPPRAIDEMNLVESLLMMVVAIATLWYRGHHDVVAMMTASPAREAAVVQPPAPFTPENKEALQKWFPFAQRPASSRRKDQFRNPGFSDKENVAAININLIREGLSQHSWVLNIPNDWIKQLPNHTTGRRYYLKSDIRNKLAELAISIATRSL